MHKISACFFAFLLLCMSGLNVFAEGITIEQVVSSRPNVNVYGDFDVENLSQITASATIGEEKLDFVEARTLGADEGILYMFLVDCSTSISGSQMATIKKALHTFSDEYKMPNDRVCIISFGLQTDVLCDGHETDEEIKNAIDKLNNTQDGTVLFDAIDKAVELSEISDSTLPQRKVAIIISDADDFNVGGHTVEEIINLASVSSLPFYSVGLRTGSKTGLDTFGQISRASGAKIIVASETEIGAGLVTIVEDIKDCDLIRFSADGNVISGKQQLFNLSVFSGGKTYTASRTISDLQWSEDKEAPYITECVQLAPNILKLTFSEDVLYAGDTSSYVITKNRKTIPLAGVSYEKSTHSATLTFANTPVSGKYNLQLLAVTDNSMEKNAFGDDVFTVKIKGRNIVVAGIVLLFTDYWWILLILFIIVAGLVSYAVLRKRNGLIFVNGKFSFANGVKIKARAEKETEKHKIQLDVKDSAGIVTQLDLSMTTSMIFGRSNICDVAFEDAKLSRQHFVIEAIDGYFTIMNLSQTNGTIVNGVKMNQRRKLQVGDKILAGQTEFCIRKLQW